MKTYTSFAISTESFVTNRAINYGDGLFETMLLVNGKLPLWDLHYQRLEQGLGQLAMETIDKQELYDKILTLIDDNKTYIVKLVVFRGDVVRGYASKSQQTQFYLTANIYMQPSVNNNLAISKIRLSKQKRLAGVKHLNRLEQVLAANALNKSAYTDALMLDSNENIIETISKNIILSKNGKLYTPKLNKCGVHGVALRWLQTQGYKLNWKKIEFKSLNKYHAIMVCNSVQGFKVITQIANKYKFEQNLPIFVEIQQKWHKYINS